MLKRRRISLAWYNLTQKRLNFALALGGITFAVFLMFMQLGFLNALFDSTVLLHRRIDGDILIMHAQRRQLALPVDMSRRRLQQAEAVEGVAEVLPIYIDDLRGQWRYSGVAAPGGLAKLRILAVDPQNNPLIGPDATPLELTGRVLADDKSKPLFGLDRPASADPQYDLLGRDVKLAGRFRLGTDFTIKGNVLVGLGTYAETARSPFMPDPLASVDIGVVRVTPEYQDRLGEVVGRIRDALPSDVKVRTKQEAIDEEIEFWRKATPIGFAFTFGTIMGFVVGVVICNQILTSNVSQYQAEYATLRAIGYTNGYLRGVVLRQALILSLFGFLPGLIVSWLAYNAVEADTGLPLFLTPGRVGLVLAITVGMCLLSGLSAFRKVVKLDPADVF